LQAFSYKQNIYGKSEDQNTLPVAKQTHLIISNNLSFLYLSTVDHEKIKKKTFGKQTAGRT